MQNRGFIRLFAIALSLICLFYLSFSFVARHYNNMAERHATIDGQFDEARFNNFLDSISGKKVWMGYTFNEVLDRQVNLGLDLRGGMSVMLEISVADILRVLSAHNTDANFTEALRIAAERQQATGRDFLSLFEQAFTELDSDARLSAIFSTFELRDRVSPHSTNAQVMEVLNEEVSRAIDNSFNVLRTRIDRFGVVQPNIQRLEGAGRILVELPGVKERERVRRLLQGTANLEFFETYDLALDPEIFRAIIDANTVIRNLQAAAVAEDEAEEGEIVAITEEDAIEEAIEESRIDLLAEIAAAQAADELTQFDAINNPLFNVLHVSQHGGPVVGRALAADTATVNEFFALRQVRELFPRDMLLKWTVNPTELELADGSRRNFFELIAIRAGRDGRPALDGSVIVDARDDFGQFGGSEVSMTMDAEGARQWALLTRQNIGRSVAIVLDGYVYSFPRVNSEITGGRSSITGNFTPYEARDLANILRSGTMPAPARIVQEDVVGPSLGQEAIDSGLRSFVIAFFFVMLYLIFYYGWKPGMVANFALITNVFFLVGILVAWRATLTLPGIAGIILTIGIAIDSNVLIYERIREELRAGKNIKKAVPDGFKNALSAILDANVTSLMIGIILAYFGTGPIQGFATTFIIGVFTSVFTAVFVTRVILEWLAEKDKLNNVAFTTELTKNWFQNTKFNFVGMRKKAYIVAGTIVVVTTVSLAVRGLDPGIDFTGGRNYVVRFEQPVSTVTIHETLRNQFDGATVSVITIGTENQVRISTNYGIDNDSDEMGDRIEAILFEGLQPFLNENVTMEMFITGYIIDDYGVARVSLDPAVQNLGVQSSQKVGPTIAADIKTSAAWSIILAIIALGLYILIRFRDFAFSIGVIASLTLNVIIVFCMYSLLYGIMPFSLEVNQHFIAAVLTVVAYSINDTVVVFDRVREIFGLYPKREKKDVMNEALNATLSRTFSTTFSTVMVLLIIFIFGGDVIRGFIFALLIGVSVGSFSTLFIASPIAYDIQGRKRKKTEIEN